MPITTTRTTTENPVINSPFKGLKRHFRFTKDGITDTIIQGRRKGVYFVPIAKSKTRGKNLELDFPVESRPEENCLINRHPGARRAVACERLSARHPDHPPSARPLERSTPRAPVQ
jgi:hypothetical protein